MPDASPPVSLAVEDVRPFVAVKDFRQSLRFYEALGWRTVWTDGQLALLELGANRLYLQDYYVKDWAENSMLVVVVDDPAAWYEHARNVLAAGDYGEARVTAPKREDWGATVTYVWDPSGVLLHFTRFEER